MKQRNKLYKENPETWNFIYRKYQNKIEDLLKVSKQIHYKKYFEDNRKNCKALWDGIHQIIYSNKKKDNNSPSSLLVNGQTVTNST